MSKYFKTNKLSASIMEMKIIYSTKEDRKNQHQLNTENYKMLTLGLCKQYVFNENKNKEKEKCLNKITFYTSYYDQIMFEPKKIIVLNKYKEKSYNTNMEDNYLFLNLINKNFYKNLINKKQTNK